MSTYAIVEAGTVINVVEWDGVSDWTPPEGTEAVPIEEGINAPIGASYDGSTFTAPEAQ